GLERWNGTRPGSFRVPRGQALKRWNDLERLERSERLERLERLERVERWNGWNAGTRNAGTARRLSPRGSLRLPRHGPALDLLKQHRGDQAEDANGDDADEHDVDLEELPRVPDQVADATLGGDELGRHQHDEGDRERDAQAA